MNALKQVEAAPGLVEAVDCPTADELEADGSAPWQGRQPIEAKARRWRGKLWVPLDVAIPAFQFWQRRDYEHSRSSALRQAEAAPGVVEALREALETIAAHIHSDGVGTRDKTYRQIALDALALARQHGAREGKIGMEYDPYEEAEREEKKRIAADVRRRFPAAPATDVGEG